MGWASRYIIELLNGRTVQFRPTGTSMQGRVESGELCTVEPVDLVYYPGLLKVGDVVLCKVQGVERLHLVLATDGSRWKIGNNRGHVNGWVGPKGIYGKLTKVEP